MRIPPLLVLLVLHVLLFCAAACGRSDQDPPGHSEDEVAEAIGDLTARLASSWVALDADAYLVPFPEDLVFYIQGSRVYGDDFRAAVRASVSSLRESTFEIADQETEVLGRNAGVTTFTLREVMTDTTGQVTDIQAVLTLVVERRNGNWMIVRAHESFSTG